MIGCNSSDDELELYVRELEDEVMTLRAQLQVMANERNNLDINYTNKCEELADVTNQLCEMERDRDGWRTAAEAQSAANNELANTNKLLANERDFWQREAEMWRQECNLRSGGHEWHTYSGAKKVARWNNNTGRYEPDPDDH